MGGVQRYLSQRDRVIAFERHMAANDEFKARQAEANARASERMSGLAADIESHFLAAVTLLREATDWRPWVRWRARRKMRGFLA